MKSFAKFISESQKDLPFKYWMHVKSGDVIGFDGYKNEEHHEFVRDHHDLFGLTSDDVAPHVSYSEVLAKTMANGWARGNGTNIQAHDIPTLRKSVGHLHRKYRAAESIAEFENSDHGYKFAHLNTVAKMKKFIDHGVVDDKDLEKETW